ncbi:hypothetical protein REPUB_Repub18cG0140900 [Reevesia pubescens]
MENLNVLEETFMDSNVIRLEREILLELGRLGALKLFNICLSRTQEASNVLDLSDVPADSGKLMNGLVDSQKDKVIVCSREKKQRQKRIERAVENPIISTQLLPSNTLHGRFQKPKISSAKTMSKSRRKISIIARNEAEMS